MGQAQKLIAGSTGARLMRGFTELSMNQDETGAIAHAEGIASF